MIYLDHNATTPLSEEALAAMEPFLREQWGNPSSPHRFGAAARAAVETARHRIASVCACRPEELIFCSSGTEANNLALRGVARALRGRGKHLITSAIEHHAVLHTCAALGLEGFDVSILPVTSDGVVDVAVLERTLRPDTTLVSVMLANNETGVVQPVAELAELAHRRGALFHTDAVQATGKLPLEFESLGVDLATISGHKVHGPKGAAALYVRAGTPLTAMTTGGAQEFGLRAGTENVAAVVGFAEALVGSAQTLQREATRVGELRDRLERAVTESLPGVWVQGGRVQRVANTSNLRFAGVDGESIVVGLDVLGICASTGSACSTGEPEPSHVLRAMGLDREEAQGAVRFSLGRGTGEGDVERTVQALRSTVARLRRISSVGGVAS